MFGKWKRLPPSRAAGKSFPRSAWDSSRYNPSIPWCRPLHMGLGMSPEPELATLSGALWVAAAVDAIASKGPAI